MTPYAAARLVYDVEPCAHTFDEDLVQLCTTGWVCSSPEVFIMGRPVFASAEPALIVDSSYSFPEEVWNCWHIHLYAGNLAKAFDIEPYHFPWISFERKNKLRFWDRAKIHRIIGGL